MMESRCTMGNARRAAICNAPCNYPETCEYVVSSEEYTFGSGLNHCAEVHGTELATIITVQDRQNAINVLVAAGLSWAWVGLKEGEEGLLIDPRSCCLYANLHEWDI